MPEFDAVGAKNRVLGGLDRAMRSYTAANSLSALALVPGEDLMPIFRRRAELGMNTLLSKLGLEAERLDALNQRMAEVSVASAQNAIAAACLVFSHSLADVGIDELCMVVADFDQASWVKLAENRTITVRQ